MALKKARRLLKRINGVLTVVYIDSQTGEQVTDLSGYELESADGNSQLNLGTTPPSGETQAAQPLPSSGGGNSRATYQGAGDDGMPEGVYQGNFGDFVKDVAALPGKARNAAIGAVGGAIGKAVGIEQGEKLTTPEAGNAAGKAVRGFGSDILETTRGWGDNIKNIFGGGSEEVASETSTSPGITPSSITPVAGKPVSANEMFTYRDIDIRKLPVSEEYMTNMAAAANAVNPNLRFEISSAGQPTNGKHGVDRTGSHRHDVDENGLGQTADLMVFLDGVQQTPKNNPELFDSLVRSAATMGFTGIGVSPHSNFIHVGGGEPAVWSYDAAGNDIAAPANIKSAYDQGWVDNASGKGKEYLTAYTTQVAPQPTQTAGVSPELEQAVTGYRSAKGLPIIKPSVQPLADAATGMITNPVPGGQVSLPPFGASYDPNQMAMVETVPEEVSSGGLGMVADTETGERNLDALLRTLNEAEGSPKANQLFGYGTFDDFTTHPNQKVAYNDGRDYSTAAGLFQINKGTWDEFAPKAGVQDFTEDSQYKVARAIAKQEYQTKTGRDLVSDLASGNKDYVSMAYDALANRWSSLPSGVQARTKKDDLLTSYETHSAFSPSKPVSASSVLGIEDATRGVPKAASAVSTPKPKPEPASKGFMGPQQPKSAAKAPVTTPAKTSSSPTYQAPKATPAKATSPVSKTPQNGFMGPQQPAKTTQAVTSTTGTKSQTTTTKNKAK